eukprot:scaffold228967_cov27-Tisochrysis_lutea.AAC.1
MAVPSAVRAARAREGQAHRLPQSRGSHRTPHTAPRPPSVPPAARRASRHRVAAGTKPQRISL